MVFIASGLYHKKEELAPPLAPIPLLLLLVLFFTAPFCTTHVCFRGASALRRLKHVESVFAMLGLTLAALPRLELCGRQENVRGFEAWYKM